MWAGFRQSIMWEDLRVEGGHRPGSTDKRGSNAHVRTQDDYTGSCPLASVFGHWGM